MQNRTDKENKNGKYQDLEKYLMMGIIQCRTQNLLLSRNLIKEKVGCFAKELGLTDFKGSND